MKKTMLKWAAGVACMMTAATCQTGRTALLIEGLRRVGKSSLAEGFGRNECRTIAKALDSLKFYPNAGKI